MKFNENISKRKNVHSARLVSNIVKIINYFIKVSFFYKKEVENLLVNNLIRTTVCDTLKSVSTKKDN